MAVDVQWAAGEESINFMCRTPLLVELFFVLFVFVSVFEIEDRFV